MDDDVGEGVDSDGGESVDSDVGENGEVWMVM